MKVLIMYSGGKDSQASMIWAVQKYGAEKCEAVFCNTHWENPVTLEHIKKTTSQLGVKLVTLDSIGMVELSKFKKRFPSAMARFCTDFLKIRPTIDYILSHNENLMIIEGIRRNESLARSKMNEECTFFKYYFEPYKTDQTGRERFHSYRKKEVYKWCTKFNADKVRPVFYWGAQQTIDYIIENGQQPNTLYFQGFTRVGCFPCIMASHRDVKLISDNHPEMWKRLEKAEKEVKHSYFRPDYIPKHAIKNGKFPLVPDVKKYLEAKNATLNLFETETPGCMSAYNLCE